MLSDCQFIDELNGALGYGTNEEKMAVRLAEILVRDDHCVFVATIQDQVAGWIHGFVSLRLESDSFAEIGGLVIRHEDRRLGIGKLLVMEVLKWAKEQGRQKLRVRSNTARKESHHFFRHIGFSLTKEQKVYDILVDQFISKLQSNPING